MKSEQAVLPNPCLEEEEEEEDIHNFSTSVPPTHMPPKQPFPSGFPTKILYACLICSIYFISLSQLIPLHLITLITLGEDLKL
jgi:hypothetical protein